MNINLDIQNNLDINKFNGDDRNIIGGVYIINGNEC